MGTLTSLSLSKTEVAIGLSVSEWALLIFALFVVVGIIGEYKLPWYDHRLELFTLFVLIGVAGEMIADAGVFFCSGRLQTISDKEVAALNIESANLKLAASNTGLLASQADERSRTLERDNLSLQSEVLKLQAAAAWRDFTKAQRDKFISLIKAHLIGVPAFTIAVDSVVGNPEARRYGAQLGSALFDALHPPKPIDGPFGLSTCLECTGVWICVNENALPGVSKDAKAIRDMLALSGVMGLKNCSDPKNGQGTPNNIKIIVGPKP
jgi:hypothetical protein